MAPAPQGPTPRVPWPQPSTIGPKLNFQGSSACPLPPLPPPSPPSPTPWLHGPSGPGPYPHGPMVQPSTIELSFKGSSACQLPPLPPTAPHGPLPHGFMAPAAQGLPLWCQGLQCMPASSTPPALSAHSDRSPSWPWPHASWFQRP